MAAVRLRPSGSSFCGGRAGAERSARRIGNSVHGDFPPLMQKCNSETNVGGLVSPGMCYNIGRFLRGLLMKRQNVLYPKAAKALRTLGENLRLARRRRAITACMMAERANLSLMTLRSIERGSPHVSMCNYMAVIACLGFQDDIAAVAANDILGRDLQDAKL